MYAFCFIIMAAGIDGIYYIMRDREMMRPMFDIITLSTPIAVASRACF